MNVLELCLSDGKGGLELYVFRTAIALQQANVSCLAVVAGNTFLHGKFTREDLPCTVLTRLTRFVPLFSARKLARVIDSQRIDILHVHWGKDLLLAVIAKRLASRKPRLVYTRQMMITRPKKDVYHRFVYSSVDLYIAITDQLRDLARQYLPMPSERIIRLYYGVKTSAALDGRDRDILRSEWLACTREQAQNRFFVGIVGRIEEQKGQVLLIRALKNLLPVHASIVGIIIGPAMSDDYLASLKSLVAELGLNDNVCFLGPHPNPIEIMAVLDVLVLATRMETFGLVLVEAMRAGVPVIGSNAGGVPEIISHAETGLLFEPDNADDLAVQIRRLYEDTDLRQRVADAGRQRADAEFSHERHYAQLVKIFRDQVG